MIVRELLTRLGLRVDDKGFKKADKSIKNTIGGLKGLVGALVGGFVIRGVGRFINSQIDLADNIGKTATQLGIGVEALQEFRFAADLAGVEAAKFDQALALLQKNAFDAATGSKEFADDFKKLGISVKDTNGQLKDGPTLILEMADGIAALDNESEKVAIALSLMGRSGRQLLPLFTDGAKGIEAMRKEARELGFILGEEDVRAAELAKDELTRFGRVVQGMKNQVFLAVLPSIIEFTRGFINLGKRFSGFLRDAGLVKTGLFIIGAAALAAGVAFLVAFAGPLLLVAKLTLIFGAMVLVLNDVLTLFAGGQSAVGAFIDELFGLGTADAFVANHRAGIEAMTDSWNAADGSVIGFLSTLAGAQLDFESVGDTLRGLGATAFDVGQEIVGAIVGAFAKILEAAGNIDFLPDSLQAALKSQAGALNAAGKAFKFERITRATGRGTGAGRLTDRIQGRRGDARAALAGRNARRDARRQAQAAGVDVEGLTFRRGQRATGRGTGAEAERIRFGRARAARGGGGATVTQDNRIDMIIQGEGLSPEEIAAEVAKVVATRDEDNRRKAIGALAQTAGGA